MIRVTFIRHGESTWNAAQRWQGQGDAPLSERGRAQAAQLGGRLRSMAFDRVECSDLSRAADTAAALGREVHADPAWRELSLGEWEGLLHSEVAARFPEQIAALRAGAPVKVGGGESWPELRVRVEAALARLRGRLRPGAHAAVVCHGGVIMTLSAALLGVAGRTPRPVGRLENTSLTTFAFTADQVVLEAYNDAAHAPYPIERPRERLEGVSGHATAQALVAPPPGASLAHLALGRVGHVVAHGRGRVLADWNVIPRGE